MRNSEEGFTFGDFTAEEWEKYFSNSLAQIGNIPPVEFLFNFNYSDDEERGDNFLAGDSSTHVSNDSSAAAKNVTAGLEDSGVEVGQESEQETFTGKLAKTTAGTGDCLPEAKQKQVKQSSEKTIQSNSEHIVFGGNSIKEHEQDVRQSKPESPSRTSATDVDQFPPLSLTVNTQRAVEKTETERSRKRRKRRRQRKRSGSVSSSSSECSEKERASVNSNGSGLKGKAVASLPTTDKVVLSDDVKEASKVQVNVLSARLKEQKSDALSNTDKRTAVQRKSTSSCDGDTVEERKSSLSTEGTSNSPVYSDTDIKVTVSISTAQDPLSSNQTYKNLEKEHESPIPVDQSVKTSGAPEEITGRKDQPPKPSSWADLFKNSAKPLPGIVVKTVSPVVRNEMQTTSNPKKTDDTLQIPVTVEEDKFAKKFAESIQRQELQYIQKPYIPRGLINRGNWCYINATLQALVGCPPFFNLLRQLPLLKERGPTSTPILDSLIVFMNEFKETKIKPGGSSPSSKPEFNTGEQFEPVYVYKMLAIIQSSLSVKGRQEDAQEFLSCILNGLHEEMLQLAKIISKPLKAPERDVDLPLKDEDSADDDEPKAEEQEDEGDWEQVGPKNKSMVTRMASYPQSLISEIFGGFLRSSVHQAGLKDSANVEPFFELQLDVQVCNLQTVTSVEDALKSLALKEEVQGYTCTKTKVQRSSPEAMRVDYQDGGFLCSSIS